MLRMFSLYMSLKKFAKYNQIFSTKQGLFYYIAIYFLDERRRVL